MKSGCLDFLAIMDYITRDCELLYFSQGTLSQSQMWNRTVALGLPITTASVPVPGFPARPTKTALWCSWDQMVEDCGHARQALYWQIHTTNLGPLLLFFPLLFRSTHLHFIRPRLLSHGCQLFKSGWSLTSLSSFLGLWRDKFPGSFLPWTLTLWVKE